MEGGGSSWVDRAGWGWCQYVFRDGAVDGERLGELVETVGRKRLVLDLSCRKKVRHSSVAFFCHHFHLKAYSGVVNRW